LVQVSTAAVYEPLPDRELDETVKVEAYGSAYKQVKLKIEDVVLEAVRSAGLDAVILQPTVVYGPRGGAWTDSPIRELLTGTVVLPDRGEGLCNAVFVDDVCRAILAAVAAQLPPGERILVSGEQPVTWKAFYGAFDAMLGLDALELQPPEPCPADAPPDTTPRSSGADRVRQVARRLFGARMVGQANLAARYAISLVAPRRLVATGAKSALFRSRCHVRIDKARAALGFEPAFDLERGMEATRPYVTSSYGRLARLKRRR
jgi:nucleoside-diphosphate-sugar epimerase